VLEGSESRSLDNDDETRGSENERDDEVMASDGD
jgi:hypothetical protein